MSENQIKKYIDLNKNNRILYDNLYLKDFEFVIKIPFQDSRKRELMENIRIEKFTLTNCIYILNYD